MDSIKYNEVVYAFCEIQSVLQHVLNNQNNNVFPDWNSRSLVKSIETVRKFILNQYPAFKQEFDMQNLDMQMCAHILLMKLEQEMKRSEGQNG